MQEVIKNPNVYLIIDDAQKMYDIRSFWTSLKKNTCRVICFATSVESRLGSADKPKELENSLRYETVRFSVDDKIQLVDKFRNNSDLGKKLLTDQVIALIDLLTNRHPGLLYASLKNIVDYVNHPESKENFKVCSFVCIYY